MVLKKIKLRKLLSSKGYTLSDVLCHEKDIIVYGVSNKDNTWAFWRYSPVLMGLGSLRVISEGLSKDEALFKRDVLLGGVIKKENSILSNFQFIGGVLGDKNC